MADASRLQRVVVAISGASGAIYGVRLLQMLRHLGGVQTHLTVSAAGWLNLRHELGIERAQLEALADVAYRADDLGAAIASGSFAVAAMVIAPCSMRTLAAVAHGLSDNLMTRAADVTLKERRRLVLLARETPLNLAHLRNMVSVTEMGAIVFPPLPAFYQRPASIDEMVDHTVARVIDHLGLAQMPQLATPWAGLDPAPAAIANPPGAA